jgi:hypothetical protein
VTVGYRRPGQPVGMWKRFLWDEGGMIGLSRIFPKAPTRGMINKETGNPIFAHNPDGKGLTTAGTTDYDQAMTDYNSFYQNLRENTDWDWTETSTPKHEKIGPTPRYTQHYQKVFGETVPAMYSQMPALDTGALYNLPQQPFGIQGILDMGRRKR